MAEYIKREDALNAIPKLICTSDDRLAMEFIKTFIKISALQNADVRENVRGVWLNFHGEKMPLNKRGKTTGECYCSVCKMFLVASDEYECYGNFCPHCGADMRGESDG